MRRLLILVAALALLTTACKIEVNAHFTVNADQSGEVVLEMGFDDEALAFAASEGGDPTEMFSDIDFGNMPGATGPVEERRGDMTFYIITVPIEDLTAAEGLGGDMAAGLTDSFDIQFTEDRVIVEGNTDLGDALGEDTDMSAIPVDMLRDIFSINIFITMPGKIIDHNATSADGNTLKWEIDLTSPTLDIYAESNPNESSGGGSMTTILIIVAAVVVLGLLLWLWSRTRKSSTSGAAEAPPAPAPGAGEVAPPPPPPTE